MNTILKYVRKTYREWLVAFVVTVAYGAYAANEANAQSQAGTLKTTKTSFSITKEGRVVFTDNTGDYFVGDDWKSANVVGTLDYYGNTVYLIVGKYGNGQCPEKWTVVMTAEKKSYSRIWVLPTCKITDLVDFDVTVNTISVFADNKAYSFEP